MKKIKLSIIIINTFFCINSVLSQNFEPRFYQTYILNFTIDTIVLSKYITEDVFIISDTFNVENWKGKNIDFILPDSLPNGKWVILDKNNFLIYSVNYKNGDKNGLETYYWGNNNIRKITEYYSNYIEYSISFNWNGSIENLYTFSNSENNGYVFKFDLDLKYLFINKYLPNGDLMYNEEFKIKIRP